MFTTRRSRRAAIVVIALVGLSACGSDSSASPDGSAAPPPSPTDTAASGTATSGSATSDSASPPASDTATSPAAPNTTIAEGVGEIGPTTQRLVDVAVADLVERIQLDDAHADAPIVVASVEEVTWRDAALGCPAEGMQYAQVLTPGIRIVLEHDGTSYDYHAGSGDPAYCAQPEPPLADG